MSEVSQNVRQDLLREAGKLLRTQGHARISVRQVALKAGVSSGAPYHHFPDRRALLIALAIDGFEQLMTIAKATIAFSQADPAAMMRALASEFLDFCSRNPELADLMYESELTRPIDEALKPAFQAIFDLLTRAVASVSGSASEAVIVSRTLSFWATIFGLARLSRNDLLEPFAAVQGTDWRDLIVAEATSALLRED